MPRKPNAPKPEPCFVCGAPATRRVSLKWACDDHAEPLHRAALKGRDALVVALSQMAKQGPDELEGKAA